MNIDKQEVLNEFNLILNSMRIINASLVKLQTLLNIDFVEEQINLLSDTLDEEPVIKYRYGFIIHDEHYSSALIKLNNLNKVLNQVQDVFIIHESVLTGDMTQALSNIKLTTNIDLNNLYNAEQVIFLFTSKELMDKITSTEYIGNTLFDQVDFDFIKNNSITK